MSQHFEIAGDYFARRRRLRLLLAVQRIWRRVESGIRRRHSDDAEGLDPEVVARMVGRKRRADPLDALSPREREVLAVFAKWGLDASIVGIVTADDKFLKFDAAGNQKALAVLQKTTKPDNLRVKVTGDVTGDQIAVASITLE